MSTNYPAKYQTSQSAATTAAPAPTPPIPLAIDNCLKSLEDLGSVVDRLESKLSRVIRPHPVCPDKDTCEQSSPGMLADLEMIHARVVLQRNRLQNTIDALML